MTEELNEMQGGEQVPSMDEFKEELDKSMKKIRRGDIVECTVISVSEEEVLVNLGYISDGVIQKKDLVLGEDEAVADQYEAGQNFKAEVIKVNDGDGNVVLSLRKAQQILVWEQLQDDMEKGNVIEVKVKESVKGGVVADVDGLRGFIPASLLSVDYVENLKDYEGKKLQVIVKEADPRERKLILSRKDVEAKEREAKRKLMYEELKKDDVFTGKVKKLMSFGAFVDIGGVDGLLHINDMSWTRLKHPSEAVKEGQTVEVVVLGVDRERQRISLGLKDIGENPWKKAAEKYPAGSVVEGEVVRLADFGAFVSVEPGLEGLVHVSELDVKRVNLPQDVVSVGQKVNVKVLKVDAKNQKLSLSIKRLMEGGDVPDSRGGRGDRPERGERVDVSKFNDTEEATTNLGSVFKDLFDEFK